MGRLRNLSSDEILAQMFFATQLIQWEALQTRHGIRPHSLPPITNIVFMGMGEPADNADNVKIAAEILTTRECFGLSATRVTVSTVAPSPLAFENFVDSPVVVAWSVHAADDVLRKRLVPTTKFSMAELRQGLIDTLNRRPMKTTMLEVALMADVNDSLRDADTLAEFVQVILDDVPGCKLIINLIPFNDIGSTNYRTPSHEAVVAFQKRLQSRGLFSHIRTTRGDDTTAACGQLATKKLRTVTTPP